MTRIYKILPRADWRRAETAGVYGGSALDLADGFMHFSTAGQAAETARRHFAGQADLVVVEIEAGDLGSAVRWEPSRGGDLFPHLYGALPTALARRVIEAPLDAEGIPQLGELS